MTLHPIHRRTGLLLLALLMPLAPLRAEEPSPAQASTREILRDALYAEEVTRDATKAAENYTKVLELYKAQQPFAATALFRLAEVRRKQGNKEEAATLYQQLLREFPNAEIEGKLARENLAAMGGTAPPDAAAPAEDNEESKELRRLQELARTSPDLARKPELLSTAASQGQSRVMAFLIDSGIAPQSRDFLTSAVSSGNLKAVEFLISKGCDPAKAPNDSALTEAVKRGYHSIAELLLKSGADVNYKSVVVEPSQGQSSTMSPLHLAAAEGDERMCRLLLDHKADPNFIPKLCFPTSGPRTNGVWPVGSPLLQAIETRSGDRSKIIALLLKAGAKPGEPATTTGLTPLHFAARRKDLELLRQLLDVGVPVNPQTLAVPNPSPGRGQPTGSPFFNHTAGITPLHDAVESGPEEAVRMLLAKGADPNLAGQYGTALSFALNSRPELVPLLLEKGAKVSSPMMLINAIARGADTTKRLLDAGADPNAVAPDYGPPLQYAIGQEKPSPEVIQLLIDRGATVGGEWLENSLRTAQKENRRILIDRFILPELLAKPAISLILLDRPSTRLDLAKREGGTSPPPLEVLLLNHGRLPYFNVSRGPVPSRRVIPSLVTIHRKDAGGAIRKLEGKIDGSAPLPKLEWGDVVELAGDPAIVGGGTPAGGQEQLPADAFWNLRKHIAVPITVNMAGKPREITLRGDTLTYHPGGSIAPLLPVKALAPLFWGKVPPHSLMIRRSGWPEIELASGGPEWNKFELQPGDELTPVYRDGLAKRESETRSGMVTVTIHGTDFGKVWDATVPAAIPTLVEVITDLCASWSPGRVADLPENESERWGVISARQQGVSLQGFYTDTDSLLPVPVVPDHPDFSKIRIHRQDAEGKEIILEIDLAKAIAATTEASSQEEARGRDVKLQEGDLIEIPLKQPGGKEAWTGFNEAEVRFFSKVLDGTFQVTDDQGNLRRRVLAWQPVKWLTVAGQPLPLPPDQGVASTIVTFQEGYDNYSQPLLSRGGEDITLRHPGFFLRDGDRLRVQGGGSVPGQVPAGQGQPAQPVPPPPQPRRRVVLPPSPSR